MIRIVALVVCLLAGVAHAETHRLAIVLGNNIGTGESPPLHFAELDATKLSQALVDLGGVARTDLYLLQGGTLAEVRGQFARAASQVAAWRREPEARVVLLFYFSGHSDGVALELGSERLAFTQLRAWLAGTGADVRVVIVDSCRSGALLAAKGGKPGAGFQIRLSDSVASNGEALLTSSAADEIALESREIHGSFFTHHLVSGLRGAADLSGDGNVTLGEAYQYAFARTVTATSATTYGPQHPAYDYRLTGEGELVLASSAAPSAHIALPNDFDRVLLVHLTRDQVLAELPRGTRRSLAVPAGSYEVRAWRGGAAYTIRLALRDGETRALRSDELAFTALGFAATKGGFDNVRAPRPQLAVLTGWQRGVADDLDMLGLSVDLRQPGRRGWSARVDFASARGISYRELGAAVLAGYFVATGRRLRVDAGVQLGLGLARQTRDAFGTYTSGAALAVPALGITVPLGARVALRGETRLTAELLKRDGAMAVLALPSAFVGVSFGL